MIPPQEDTPVFAPSYLYKEQSQPHIGWDKVEETLGTPCACLYMHCDKAGELGALFYVLTTDKPMFPYLMAVPAGNHVS